MVEGERRRGPRRALDDPIAVRVQDGTVAGRLRSVSRMGGLVQLESALQADTPIVIVIAAPGAKEPLELPAQVLRVEYSGSSSGMAVLFSPLSPQALGWIDRILEE